MNQLLIGLVIKLIRKSVDPDYENRILYQGLVNQKEKYSTYKSYEDEIIKEWENIKGELTDEQEVHIKKYYKKFWETNKIDMKELLKELHILEKRKTK